MTPPRALAVVVIALFAACSTADVDLHITFDDAVDVSRLASLRIGVSGADTWSGDVPVNDRVRTEREARLVYHAAADSGSLDSTGTRFAANTLPGVALHAHEAVAATIRLAPAGPEPTTDLPIPDLPDLPSPDGNPTEMGAPGSVCATGSFLKCEDFETPLGTRWIPSTSPPWATFELSTARAYRGSSSLHFTGEVWSADMGANYFASAFLVDNSISLDTMYFRAFIYVPSGSTGGLQTSLLSLRQVVTPFEVAELGYNANRTLQLAWASGARDATSTFAINRWVCVEWMFSQRLGDGGTLQQRVWLDGVEAPELAVVDLPRTAPFGRVELGVYKIITSTTPAIDLYMDEVVFDDKRIGCGP